MHVITSEFKPTYRNGEEPISGIHMLVDMHFNSTEKIRNYSKFKPFIISTTKTLGLHILGDLFHNFSPEGFTGIICLSESHISIHTFPEKKYATLDVYLSNFTHDNSPKGRIIVEMVQSFLQPSEVIFKEIPR